MQYQSIDNMQKTLSNTVFAHTDAPKKAAGRALGTMIEIIGFYLLKTWGHEYTIAIEKPLFEYANDISHNVEFTFHRNKFIGKLDTPQSSSITSTWLFNSLNAENKGVFTKANRNLLKNDVIKNACTFATSNSAFCNAYFTQDKKNILLYELTNRPFEMCECKRVGVEEGNKKGPQTIEKAKQGSYVARAVSSIQRVRAKNGQVGGVIERNGKFEFHDNYYTLIENAVLNRESEILANFILTIGIVSNHGNWFTSENQNKELKVLAQSYDWLLFLTDNGLATFIEKLLLTDDFKPIQTAFAKSYEKGKKSNKFTKSNMDNAAGSALTQYFSENIKTIETWFNVITPHDKNLENLNKILKILHNLEV